GEIMSFHALHHSWHGRYITRPPLNAIRSQRRFRPIVERLEDRTLLAWTGVASMPAPRSELAATTATNGLIYALAGPNSTKNALSIAEAYHTDSNTWTEIAPMVTQRLGLAAATGLDGRIYAVDGSTFYGATNSVEAYTPNLNAWAFVSSTTTYRFDLAATGG